MDKMHYDSLNIQTMSSGHLCLNLSSKVNWHDFPRFAEQILSQSNGTVIEKVDSVDIRIWRIIIENVELKLVFDDYPTMVALESYDKAGDQILNNVLKIFAKLNG